MAHARLWSERTRGRTPCAPTVFDHGNAHSHWQVPPRVPRPAKTATPWHQTDHTWRGVWRTPVFSPNVQEGARHAPLQCSTTATPIPTGKCPHACPASRTIKNRPTTHPRMPRPAETATPRHQMNHTCRGVWRTPVFGLSTPFRPTSPLTWWSENSGPTVSLFSLCPLWLNLWFYDFALKKTTLRTNADQISRPGEGFSVYQKRDKYRRSSATLN
ncbi:hypothetical protein Dret_1531 [Desulfohalobium retbaense DSM 5692]|uniref:Uncharacterized protein n=1 Tax=Desulfohalobium retbaense (strain ATCC 49708 / DSM 5692 / JCM 16813 / HR100) TaxID=485915 RepID=C8X320_DESRD|nr:hypothetical protein Dret_1531 [Desulfohalobium retbaense DSM 5692]